MTTKDFPEVVRAARSREGLSRERLAQRLGVSASAIFRWEHGLGRPTNRAIIERVEAWLYVDAGQGEDEK